MKKIFLPVLLLLANFCFGQVNLSLGLKAYYPFSGNANDVSGNNNNPVFNNATLTADRFGNPNSAYHFDGSSSYMKILNSTSINTSNKLSLVAWVRPQGFYAGTCHGNSILMKGDADYLTGNYFLRYDDAPFLNGTNCSVPVDPAHQNFYGVGVASSPPGYMPYIQANQWYSVIVTHDGTTSKLYVDCVLKASAPQGSATFTNAYDIYIGRLNSGSFPYWVTGDIDEVRIYDRALNQDEVNTLGGCITATSCNNWLYTPSYPSYATAGDIDVSGNQITIEATYNRTAPLNGGLYPGHLVSKHTDVTNDNYSLFPNGCAITTTNGYKSTFETCGLALNKTYHVAMVYDGSFLKFYRNGFLMSQVACTGNLIVNDLPTTIAQYAGNNTSTEQFMGYVNEVRVWNVARTQAQIQTYMNNSLPNPATTTGLLAYYTFDNLVNKQGNAAFNATLVGPSTINATNSNCTFVADSCVVPFACNNWLKTQVAGQSVTVGDLDVSGNQITVEGNFNCSAYPAGTGNIWEEIVSKHSVTTDDNYSLRMNLGAITTTNGFFRTPPFPSSPCDSVLLNKTYHAAMVYDGSILKFYRNGFLMSQIAASGNLVLNNLLTTIGDYAINNPQGTNFKGYLNEIRIWNVARTQAQIQAFMNNSLPNPTTQPGLLAYYTFDNLLNKQGNASWNGTLNGGATINNTNPNCTFFADSCAVTPPTFTIINNYTPVLALNLCTNTLTVEDGTAYNVGDTVLLIQMKGAVIDSTNTSSFGTVTNYRNAGNYEFNYVKSKAGNNIELKNMITRQYDIPVGKVQLIRVPYYSSFSTSSILTCLPWDGNKGGVLAFNVLNTLNLNQDIDVSGRGFKGAPGYNPGNATLTCAENNYNYPLNTLLAAQKGESITTISNNIICGKGNPAGGGGGGLGHNSGGGGGGNGGPGGFGGYQLDNCGNAPFDNRGIGGRQLAYSTATNKIHMGSGGGAGHADNPGNVPPAGGNGAGIVIINADKIQSNTKKIFANGDNGLACTIGGSSNCHDGMGGGGAGGSILLSVNQFIDNSIAETRGGKGADMIGGPTSIAGKIGAGGGGGGGLTFLKSNSIPANLTITNTGGANGVLTQDGNSSWGATPGAAGQNLFSLVLPIDNIPFRKNIDSTRIKDSILICNSFDFKGLAYTNFSPVVNWQWNFGDGGTANTQNTTHTFSAPGTYTVRLIVTDINGCRDTVAKTINAVLFTADAGNDVLFCTATPGPVVLNASSGASYSWTPTAPLNNPTLQNPTANVTVTTRFYVTITSATGCVATDSVTVTVNAPPAGIKYPDVNTLVNQQIQLQARNLGGNSYLWLPPTGLTNNFIINPLFTYNQSQEFKITIKNAAGCLVIDTQFVKVAGKKGIYVPKAFSPNSNGINDRLYPILVGIQKLNYFRIYNRWGNLIFETNSGNPAAGWDGKINGRLQPVETYTWTVEGVDIDGILIRQSGNTLLIR